MNTYLEKGRKFLKENKFAVIICLILCIAALLRFNNFNNHWGIGNDDSRDVSIARIALERHEIPMAGSFSSAGPFVFGPIFYWTIMLSLLVFPFTFVGPWIFIVLVGLVTVSFLIYTAKLLGGKPFAIITAVFAATSPQLIIRSLTLGQHSYVAFGSALLLLSFVLLWQQQKSRYAFLMGLGLGIAINMHFQAVNLILFFATLLFIPQSTLKKKILYVIAMGIGLLIPSLPLIIWDSQQQFANYRNVLDYLLIGQYRFYVPNSWKIFLFQSFPKYWAFVIGGFPKLAIILMFTTGIVLTTAFFKRKLSGAIVASGAIFAALFILNRYYRGERSEGYLLYFLPMILIFTGYAVYLLLFNQATTLVTKRILQIAGAALAFLIIIGNLYEYKNYSSYISPTQAVIKATKQLIKKYPDKKFSVYDYKAHYSGLSQPLAFFLEKEGKIDPKGMKIGFSCNAECGQSFPEIGFVVDRPLLDLSTETDLTWKNNWVNVNPNNMYDDLIGWSKRHELKSTFTFFK